MMPGVPVGAIAIGISCWLAEQRDRLIARRDVGEVRAA